MQFYVLGKASLWRAAADPRVMPKLPSSKEEGDRAEKVAQAGVMLALPSLSWVLGQQLSEGCLIFFIFFFW